MRPKRGDGAEGGDLFRAKLSHQIDRRHPLVQLAEVIAWQMFEERFGTLYHDSVGRPGKPIRLMVGLHYLKHAFDLSDEEVCERWVENPYWQYFCGFAYFQLALPVDASSLSRFRERIGVEGMELLLKATVEAAVRERAVRKQSLERISCRSMHLI
jgi:transposase, IS5 family